MHEPRVLLLTDLVDSTRIFSALGEAGAAHLWQQHDRRARDLLLGCAAREIERGDGFLLLFDQMADAVRFADGYHALLATLDTPLTARIGIHLGPLRLRENSSLHVERGARPLDLDGQAKAITARIQSLAQARQTLASAAAVAQCVDVQGKRQSHGHWQLKGVLEPLELYEIGADESAFAPPPDAEKAWRVVRVGELWLPAREVPHSLPAERDRFVGRVAHLHALSEALARSRLVSLQGTGGTGKTRLAQRLGWSHLGDHPGGVWFCDLSAAVTPDGIVHAAAQGLQLPLGAADPVQQVGDAIAGRGDCLVILDNFEQVARHAEATLGRWLARAPRARFVVTTREVLGIVGERALELPPLTADEGEALLRERAAQAGSAAFSDADEAALPELVKLLDGLPLAIELAASRMRVMGPAALLPRMNERFRLLASRGGRPDRQATLRATLDWSWELLTEPERSALAQLSVFEGGFTLEAAQAVVDLSEGAVDAGASSASSAPWVVDMVQALVDKSLVRRVSEQRFDLLRSVQEYAQALCARVPLRRGAVRRRHGRYYGMAPMVPGSAEVRIELDNVVSACRWAVQIADAPMVAALLARAWAGLRLVGPIRGALELTRDLAAPKGPRTEANAVALWVQGSAAALLGEMDLARNSLESAVEAAEFWPPLRGPALCALGELESMCGDVQRAHGLLQSALSMAQEDPDLHCHVLNGLGALAWDQAQLATAREHYGRALTVARAHRQHRWEGALLGNMATLAYTEGSLDEAEPQYRQALRSLTLAGDRRFIGNTHCNLGIVLTELGRASEAKIHLDIALRESQALGDLRLEATCFSNLGLWHERDGQNAEALSLHGQAVGVAQRGSDPRAEGQYRMYQGRLLTSMDQLSDAEASLRKAVTLLDAAADETNSALVRCVLAEVLDRRGDVDESMAMVKMASTVWMRSELGPDSELGRALARFQSGGQPGSCSKEGAVNLDSR